MLYAAFSGDIEKAAISSKVPASVIRSLEHDFNWVAKLKRLKTGAGESEAEKVANRAVSYLQAQRMREVIENALRLVEDEEALIRALVKFKLTKEGEVEHVECTSKTLLELAKALESVHAMCYRALGDRVPVAADVVRDKNQSPNSVSDVRQVIELLSEMKRATSAPEPVVVDAIPPAEENPKVL